MVASGNIAPRFTKKPSLRQDGTSIVFECEIEASPTPSVTWFRGEDLLTDTARLTTKLLAIDDTDLYGVSLVVSNVSPADSGTYRVEVNNSLGKMTANINLNMQRKLKHMETVSDLIYMALVRWHH